MDHRTTSSSSAGGNTLLTSSDRIRVGRPKRKPSGWRRKAPLVASALVCVLALVAMLTGATTPMQLTRFALSGHWVFNSILNTLFHVDGGTATVDAHAAIQGDPGSQVVQGETSGYVVGNSRITQFSKADPSVQQTTPARSNEVPVVLEAVGGPYLVYRNAGRIVRLGDPSAIMSAGGAVGDPVVTSDGTLWLYRPQAGLVCELPKGATQIQACPVIVPADHTGALTTVDDHPEFVDFSTDQMHQFDSGGLKPGVSVGVPVSQDARPADTDVAGRVAILDQSQHHLVLADPKSDNTKPITVPLPDGNYDGPVSTGSVVAVVDRKNDTLLTYNAAGQQQDAKPVPHEQGEPRLSHGEDNRVYVEDSLGTHVLVVAKDGKVKDVPVDGKAPTPPTTQNNAPQPGQGEPGRGQQAGDTGTPPTHEPPATPVDRPPVPASPPGAPPGVSATASDSAATVTWGVPVENRSPVTSYHVSWPGGSTTVTARRVTITGLTNGTSYVFTVTATNAMGTGPGASSAPTTPYAAAAAPTVNASYSNGSATVTWSTPDLRGGSLINYTVSATGQADRTVTGNNTVYSGLSTGQTISFTVRAVTSTAGGPAVTGAPGGASVTIPAKTVTISEGAPTSSGNCNPSDCKQVDIHVVGFLPNTQYMAYLSSGSTPDVAHEAFTTRADGSGDYNNLDYDTPNQIIWVTVDGVKSNTLTWQ